VVWPADSTRVTDSHGLSGHPDNVDDEVLTEVSDAVAHRTLTFAPTTRP